MTHHVLIVHYTPPGVIGGVEHVIHQHIALLRERGHEVQVVAGRAGAGEPVASVVPEINVASPENVRLEAELADGVVSERFYSMRDAIRQALAPLAVQADVVIAHNAFTLHFSLPLTSVLWELAGRRPGSILAWCHDLSWVNPLYTPSMHPGYPWDLLRVPAPGVRYVTVSAERRAELASLWQEAGPAIEVVPNGIDPGAFLRLSPATRELVARYALFDRDAVLLLPVRITRRKNVEVGIRAVRELADQGLDVLFLISGPQASHHPGRSSTYLDELKALRSQLDMDEQVVFLADALGSTLEARVVSELYAVADVLLFPSASEGFGLPILEAGLARLPVVLSDIPIFREVGGADVLTFPLDATPATVAAGIRRALDTAPSRLYRRVLREYRWEAILDRRLLPLLGGGEGARERVTAGEKRP